MHMPTGVGVLLAVGLVIGCGQGEACAVPDAACAVLPDEVPPGDDIVHASGCEPSPDAGPAECPEDCYPMSAERWDLCGRSYGTVERVYCAPTGACATAVTCWERVATDEKFVFPCLILLHNHPGWRRCGTKPASEPSCAE
jgi:hypothetical protein